jgi:thiamine biosynthesis lipoprotein
MIEDRRVRLMGTDVRIVASPTAITEVEALLRDYDARLSRFRPDSELCALNADEREAVPASGLLRAAVRVALDAARDSGGLVDPTLLPQIEAAGYEHSWDPARRVSWPEARGRLPQARPAAPDPAARWRGVHVDDRRARISRPVGVRLDTGGTGKGHAADIAARALAYEPFWAVSCGGDLRVGGTDGKLHDVRVAHPLDRGALNVLRIRSGAVATSGIGARIWRHEDGRIAHHILDPSTGEPAYSGLVAVTALAPSAARAEVVAKTALLSGAERARELLAPHGGVIVDGHGRAETIGDIDHANVVRLSLPARTRSARSAG